MALIAPPLDLTTTEIVRRRLTKSRSDTTRGIFRTLLQLALLITIVVLLVLLLDVVTGAIDVFTSRFQGFLSAGLRSQPDEAGVYQGLRGSFWIGVTVVAVTFPIGVGSAIYLEEYAKNSRLSRFIDLNIRNLAGVPSVVYGILGLTILVGTLERITGGRSTISGALTIAILVLPIVIITAAEAIRAVPDSLREAGYGVGATRWEVIRSHVLPYAAPGILTDHHQPAPAQAPAPLPVVLGDVAGLALAGLSAQALACTHGQQRGGLHFVVHHAH